MKSKPVILSRPSPAKLAAHSALKAVTPGHILFALALLLALVLMWFAGQPRVSAQPLPIKHNGVHAPYNVRNRKGELLLFNFRAVEPKVLYRGSGFVLNRFKTVEGQKRRVAAAFFDDQAFEFLRARNVRTIICMEEPEVTRVEKEYFDKMSKKTGYAIEVRRLTVKTGHAYDTDTRMLERYPDIQDRRTALRAASDFLQFMKRRKPDSGSVYIHDDWGKDIVGVVAAGYEMWRNWGTSDPNTLWDQVMERYLVSNVVIDRDSQAGRLTGGKNDCGAGEDPNYVCAGWLRNLRPHLETIAQL